MPALRMHRRCPCAPGPGAGGRPPAKQAPFVAHRPCSCPLLPFALAEDADVDGPGDDDAAAQAEAVSPRAAAAAAAVAQQRAEAAAALESVVDLSGLDLSVLDGPPRMPQVREVVKRRGGEGERGAVRLL